MYIFIDRRGNSPRFESEEDYCRKKILEVYAAQPEQPTHFYIFKQKQNSSSKTKALLKQEL